MTNDEFANNYEKDYVKSESLWYNGASFVGKQKTNNSLESINRYLKDIWVDRQSKSVKEFLTIMEKCFIHYNDQCKELKTCMPSDCKHEKEFFMKADTIIKEKLCYKINSFLYAFVRIPSNKKNNTQARNEELQKRILKVQERKKYTQINLPNKFNTLQTFTKIHCFFHIYDLEKKICTCSKFYKWGICKHRIATLTTTKKIENKYTKIIQEGASVGRPRNI